MLTLYNKIIRIGDKLYGNKAKFDQSLVKVEDLVLLIIYFKELWMTSFR